jgi:C4-dicarboxylate-binding protein DctP
VWGDVRAALFFCLLLAPQLLMSFSAEAEQIKLGVTLQLPIPSHIGVNIVQFKEEVQRRTKGVVVVEVHDNSRLYKDDEVIAGLRPGPSSWASPTTTNSVKRSQLSI